MAGDWRRRYGEKYGEAQPPLPRREMIAGAAIPSMTIEPSDMPGDSIDITHWRCWALGRTEEDPMQPVCEAKGRYLEPGRHRHGVCPKHYGAIRRGELTSQYTPFDWTGSHG